MAAEKSESMKNERLVSEEYWVKNEKFGSEWTDLDAVPMAHDSLNHNESQVYWARNQWVKTESWDSEWNPKTWQCSSQDKRNCGAGYSQSWDDSEWQAAGSENWQSHWVKNEGWGSDWNQTEVAATGSLNDSQWQHGHGLTKMETWGSEWNQENESHAAPKTSKRKESMPTIEESIGMNLHDRHPKTAVREFLTRYLGRDLTRDDCHYSCQEEASQFRAKLHVPIWNSGIFEGGRCDSQKEAETSAARCFLEDDDVVEAATRLPAPLKVIKYWERLNKFITHKKGRRKVDPDDLTRKYNDQREQGCRMAVWDGGI